MPEVSDTEYYGYVPSQVAGIIFTALFALSTLAHTGQAIRHRMWWIFPSIFLCGFLEIVGWGSRLWSHYSPTSRTPYIIQATLTVLAPTPLLAANFVIFGKVIERLGSSYSRVSARWYTIIFTTSDVLSLLVQGTGGGLAASGQDNPSTSRLGSNIAIGGISFQLSVIIVFAAVAVEYMVRYSKDLPRAGAAKKANATPRRPLTRNLKIILLAMCFNTTCLFIRAVYRVIELAQGWNGAIAENETLFFILEGAMIVLAIYTYNIIHPGQYMEPMPKRNGFDSELTSKSNLELNMVRQT